MQTTSCATQQQMMKEMMEYMLQQDNMSEENGSE